MNQGSKNIRSSGNVHTGARRYRIIQGDISSKLAGSDSLRNVKWEKSYLVRRDNEGKATNHLRPATLNLSVRREMSGGESVSYKERLLSLGRDETEGPW